MKSYLLGVSLTRDQELWGVALWVEKHHGTNSWFHIAQQKDRLLATGDFGGIQMWDEVERRIEALQSNAVPN